MCSLIRTCDYLTLASLMYPPGEYLEEMQRLAQVVFLMCDMETPLVLEVISKSRPYWPPDHMVVFSQLLREDNSQLNGSHGEYTESDDVSKAPGVAPVKKKAVSVARPKTGGDAKRTKPETYADYRKRVLHYVQSLDNEAARQRVLALTNEYLSTVTRQDRPGWENDLMPFDTPEYRSYLDRMDEVDAVYRADKAILHAQVKVRAGSELPAPPTAEMPEPSAPPIPAGEIIPQPEAEVPFVCRPSRGPRLWVESDQPSEWIKPERAPPHPNACAFMNAYPRAFPEYFVADDEPVKRIMPVRRPYYPADVNYARHNGRTPLPSYSNGNRMVLRNGVYAPDKTYPLLCYPGWDEDGPIKPTPIPWSRPDSWNDNRIFRGQKSSDMHSRIGPNMPKEYIDNVGDGLCQLPYFERRADSGFVWSEITKSAAVASGLALLSYVPVVGHYVVYKAWVHYAQVAHTAIVTNGIVGPRNQYYSTAPQRRYEWMLDDPIPTTNDPEAINAERHAVANITAVGDLNDLATRYGIVRAYYRYQEQYQTIWIKEHQYTHWYSRTIIAELFVHLYATYSGALNSPDNLRNMKQYAHNEPTVSGRYNMWLIDSTVEVCNQFLSVSACRASYGCELRTHGLPRQSLY